MKTVKRVVAIMLLILLIWTVGYLFYTGSRLFNNSSNQEDYRGTLFEVNNKEYFLEITEELDANYYHQGIGKKLVYQDFNDGVLSYLDGETEYKFAVLPEGLYDLQLRIVLRGC
jgi:hypothetical protein